MTLPAPLERLVRVCGGGRSRGDEPRCWGRTLVVAPHPDDETLGCGGAIARLRAGPRPLPVHVVVASDGAASHPGSRRFPPARLARLRRQESVTALGRLGVPAGATTFLALADGAVPTRDDPAFRQAADRLAAVVGRFAPQTVLTTWRRDPHRDHRACAQLVRAAVGDTAGDARVLEYPIWLYLNGADGDWPRAGEVRARVVDIASVLPLKRRAILDYATQISALIDDAPDGFRMSDAQLAPFRSGYELYLS